MKEGKGCRGGQKDVGKSKDETSKGGHEASARRQLGCV